jgi:drug/metabolite transporter (DMT)-like permease
LSAGPRATAPCLVGQPLLQHSRSARSSSPAGSSPCNGRGAGAILGRALWVFLPAGVLLGLAYTANLEALDRGWVTDVTPLYVTEAFWAVLAAAAFLGKSERIGRRLILAVLLMAAGASLIGIFR